MVERRKTEAMAVKHYRYKGGISLFSEEKANYESDTKDNTDSDQVNNKYLSQN